MYFLFSNPLVSSINPYVHVCSDPVFYRKEIQRIKQVIEQSQKEIILKIEPANIQNLWKAIQEASIIHISCHGVKKIENLS
jgi:CHAT domain-containing protein